MRGLRAAHRHKTSEVEQRRLPAPVQRGLRHGVRRPQPLRRRRARRAGRGADQPGLRGRAGLPVRPRQGASRGRSRSAARTAATPPARRAPRRRASRARACRRRTSRSTDQWGNVASYTLTIEQTGGSAITVPGWGFLLNNELTDFNFVPLTAGVPDPNLPGAGQAAALVDEPDHRARGRPSVARPRLARRRDDHHLGGPDVLPGLPRPRPVRWSTPSPRRGCPRATARPRTAEPALLAARRSARRSRPVDTSSPRTTAVPPEIGAVTAIRSYSRHDDEAAAEPVRRGGGSAMVVHRSR